MRLSAFDDWARGHHGLITLAAAVLAIGDGALASHRSAARLWGAARPDTDPVDLIAPNGRRDDDLDGVVIHATRDLKPLRPQRRSGIACTNILPTLVDLGAVDAEGVGDAVGHALVTKLVDLRALETTLADHAGKGRRVSSRCGMRSMDGRSTPSRPTPRSKRQWRASSADTTFLPSRSTQ
jgi:hypothetical protein